MPVSSSSCVPRASLDISTRMWTHLQLPSLLSDCPCSWRFRNQFGMIPLSSSIIPKVFVFLPQSSFWPVVTLQLSLTLSIVTHVFCLPFLGVTSGYFTQKFQQNSDHAPKTIIYSKMIDTYGPLFWSMLRDKFPLTISAAHHEEKAHCYCMLHFSGAQTLTLIEPEKKHNHLTRHELSSSLILTIHREVDKGEGMK
jgi:hypothetical protein